jgi:hypothetical protein
LEEHEARKNLPKLRPMFFEEPVEPFTPFHSEEPLEQRV